MTTIKVSDKGQVTLPAVVRRKLHLEARSQVSVEVRDGEIVLRPVKAIAELEGVFRAAARPGGTSWEAERRHMERAVAEQVADE
ncbi:MAG TPA: AbrB/MazE/SpoVT family DNA-binding domain-containing protein [Armatimonadota bacterium]